MDVVLDTNCLIRIISGSSRYNDVWLAFLEGKYTICVSNEILAEYEEILNSKFSPKVANIVLEILSSAKNVRKLDPRFRFALINTDYDDNKFVDCAIVANALCVVTNDKHFKSLESIPFPHVNTITLEKFEEYLLATI